MNLSHLCFVLLMLPVSCSNSKKTSADKEKSKPSELKDDYEFKELEISDEDRALNALTEIQTNGDGKMMLYLTFPNIHHSECVGEVHTIEISRKEFKEVLLKVMKYNNTGISEERKEELATLASNPDVYYKVTICGATNKEGDESGSEKNALSGTWIIYNIFQTSDMLINW